MDISTFNLSTHDNYASRNYGLHNNLLSSVTTPRLVNNVPSVFTNEITPPVRTSNQKSSGRC